jgi:L-alanine-DL-glutamate epimerase-like enolase superfamily enzyme
MKIAKIEDLHADGGWRTLSFLKVTTDDGLVGWAEYNESFGVGGVSPLLHRLADTVVGMDPRAVGKISASLHAMTRVTAGGISHQAVAAVENACLDIKAKALGVPVCELFGGPYRERIPVYWTHCGSFRAWNPDYWEGLGFSPIRTLDDVKRLGEEAVARGFTSIKTNPLPLHPDSPRFNSGFRIGPDFLDRHAGGRYIAEICEVLAAFREGIGPYTGLQLDLNFNQRTEGFMRIAKAVEPYNLLWLEMDIADPEALALIRRSTATPIASLETLHGMAQFRPFLQAYAVDAAIVDVPWNGLFESVRIATLADAYEVDCAPHNFYGHLATMMSAHFCASIPNFRIMEIEVDDVPWKDEFFTAVPVIENGRLVLPRTPGWGTEINEDAVRARPANARR